MAILSDAELINELKDILTKIEYLCDDTEIQDLAIDGLDTIENQHKEKQEFLTTYAKRD